MRGYTVAVYTDHIIAIDQSFEEYLLTVLETINLFWKPGFVAHPDRSKFILTKMAEHPGFINDSDKMATCLSDQKNHKIYEKICVIPSKAKFTKKLLVLPQTPNQVHIQCGKKSACWWSICQAFRRKKITVKMLLKSYQFHGEWEQGKGTIPTSECFIVKGTLISFKQPLRLE